VSAKQAADRTLADGCILIEGSGSFCGRSLCWDSAYSSVVAGPVGYSNFCKRIDPKTGTAAIDPAQAIVCWLQMRRAYSTGELQAFRTGTAFPNFDIHGALANLTIVVPTAPVARRFADFFRQGRRLDLIAQNRTLAALRDALLPKLISGELRIADAAKIVGRAVDG
jgi:type I restriction enzyme S subunit